MNEATLVQSASRVLDGRLPGGWTQRIRLDKRAADRSNAALYVTGPDGTKARLTVETRAQLVPRAVEDIKARSAASPSSAPTLVVSTFLTPSTRERLRAANLNFLDLTGNVRLVLARPGLYVETRGADVDPSPKRPPGRSLRGAKAARIVRTLCDFELPLSISNVADKANVDISYASRLVEWLSQEALLDRKPRGAVESVDTPALIRRWAQNYTVLTANDARSFLDARGIEHLVRSVLDGSIGGRYAITGSIAANRIAPIAPARLAMLYVDDVELAASRLGLRPTEVGANVILLSPFDDVVFDRTWIDNDLMLAAPSQVAADLLTSPGRAPSEAEAILERLETKA